MRPASDDLVVSGYYRLMQLVTVYSFEQDTAAYVAAMQKASLDTSNFGLSPSPALVGTPEWWRAANDGTLVRTVVNGTISRVYWGSMGDWPEYELTADDGSKSTWTREGDFARYVEGLRARITFVLHPWKVPDQHGLGPASEVVLTVEIEESDRRSDPHAPGPGGIWLLRK